MALQGRKSSPQKSRPLESGNRRHAVWIAIKYSTAISWAKQMNLNGRRLKLPRWRHEVLSCPQMVPMVLTIQPGRIGPSFRSRVEFQVDNAQLVRSTGVKVSVMALQGRKSSPQKSRPLESGNRRHAVWIAIKYNYKLGQKMNLNGRRLKLPRWRHEVLSCPQMVPMVLTIQPGRRAIIPVKGRIPGR